MTKPGRNLQAKGMTCQLLGRQELDHLSNRKKANVVVNHSIDQSKDLGLHKKRLTAFKQEHLIFIFEKSCVLSENRCNKAKLKIGGVTYSYKRQ